MDFAYPGVWPLSLSYDTKRSLNHLKTHRIPQDIVNIVRIAF